MRLSSVPLTSEFYDLFNAPARTRSRPRARSTRALRVPRARGALSQIKELENKGDDLTRQIIELLNTQYVTPSTGRTSTSSRKRSTTSSTSSRTRPDLLTLYKVDRPMQQSLEQCRILVEAVEHLPRSESSGLRNAERHLVRVKALEDRADSLLRGDRRPLRETHVIPAEVIRWKDIFEALEDAIDACETVADVVGNIVVKNL